MTAQGWTKGCLMPDCDHPAADPGDLREPCGRAVACASLVADVCSKPSTPRQTYRRSRSSHREFGGRFSR
jgi:hypothetical protein